MEGANVAPKKLVQDLLICFGKTVVLMIGLLPGLKLFAGK